MKFYKKTLVFVFLVLGIAITYLGVRTSGQRKVIFEKAAEVVTQTKENSIKFAVMSDIHSDWDNFRTALKMAKEDRMPFVIVTGDLTTIGKREELSEGKKILEESGLRYYVIPGNHDVWYDRRTNNDYFAEVFGETFTSFKVENIQFILINNGDYINGLEGLKENEGQKSWLTKEAEKCLQITCLIFMHMPLNHPSSIYVMGQETPKVATEAALVKELLVKNKVKKIFAGHLHYSNSYNLDGLQTSIVGAVAKDRNVQSPKFTEVTVSGSNISTKEIFLND